MRYSCLALVGFLYERKKTLLLRINTQNGVNAVNCPQVSVPQCGSQQPLSALTNLHTVLINATAISIIRQTIL